MALRPDHNIISDDIRLFASTVAEKGQFFCYTSGGSGAMMDNSSATASVYLVPSGKIVAGLAYEDVVNIDPTRQHLNYYKNEVLLNSKVHLITRGYVTTNLIHGTPTIGAEAYLSENGYVRTTSSGTVASPRVGRFKSLKDEDGYATISIEIE